MFGIKRRPRFPLLEVCIKCRKTFTSLEMNEDSCWIKGNCVCGSNKTVGIFLSSKDIFSTIARIYRSRWHYFYYRLAVRIKLGLGVPANRVFKLDKLDNK